MSLEQFAAAFNTPCGTITPDTAAGMVNAGFHVFVVDIDKELTCEMVLEGRGAAPFDFEDHTFAAPRSEKVQYTALENLCEKIDSLNDGRAFTLRYFAIADFQTDESDFRWNDKRSEWENIRNALLEGETKFLHDFLEHHDEDELLRELNEYEEKYLAGGGLGENKELTLPDKEPVITVSRQSGTNNSFDVTSVGFDTEKRYTVAEFNHALKKANEKWQENWDGLSYPNNIVIVTVENLHNEACTYRVNLTDADYNSIQDIVELSPLPLYASIPTEKAIEVLDKAEANAREQGMVEHIPQQRDISHKTNNAELSAARTANGQKGSIMNTKMECTSLFLSEGNTNSKTKAVASITVNDEFVIKGIKMYESSAGNLDIVMPSRKFGNDYQDVVFPITGEAREQMKQAVLDAYVNVVKSGLDRLPLEAKDAPEKSASKVTVSIHLYQPNDETKNNVKAVGQVVIDDCIVVSGVTVRSVNKDGVEQNFVSMPSFKKMDDFGETTYSEYAHAITKECYAKISNAVLQTYETLQRTEYKGVKLSELGEKADVSTKYGINSNFAEKLMNELDNKGIAYSAKVCGTTAISVRNTDKAAVDKIEKDLSAALKKEAQKSEQKPDQKINAPKKGKAH